MAKRLAKEDPRGKDPMEFYQKFKGFYKTFLARDANFEVSARMLSGISRFEADFAGLSGTVVGLEAIAELQKIAGLSVATRVQFWEFAEKIEPYTFATPGYFFAFLQRLPQFNRLDMVALFERNTDFLEHVEGPGGHLMDKLAVVKAAVNGGFLWKGAANALEELALFVEKSEGKRHTAEDSEGNLIPSTPQPLNPPTLKDLLRDEEDLHTLLCILGSVVPALSPASSIYSLLYSPAFLDSIASHFKTLSPSARLESLGLHRAWPQRPPATFASLLRLLLLDCLADLGERGALDGFNPILDVKFQRAGDLAIPLLAAATQWLGFADRARIAPALAASFAEPLGLPLTDAIEFALGFAARDAARAAADPPTTPRRPVALRLDGVVLAEAMFFRGPPEDAPRPRGEEDQAGRQASLQLPYRLSTPPAPLIATPGTPELRAILAALLRGPVDDPLARLADSALSDFAAAPVAPDWPRLWLLSAIARLLSVRRRSVFPLSRLLSEADELLSRSRSELLEDLCSAVDSSPLAPFCGHPSSRPAAYLEPLTDLPLGRSESEILNEHRLLEGETLNRSAFFRLFCRSHLASSLFRDSPGLRSVEGLLNLAGLRPVCSHIEFPFIADFLFKGPKGDLAMIVLDETNCLINANRLPLKVVQTAKAFFEFSGKKVLLVQPDQFGIQDALKIKEELGC